MKNKELWKKIWKSGWKKIKVRGKKCKKRKYKKRVHGDGVKKEMQKRIEDRKKKEWMRE